MFSTLFLALALLAPGRPVYPPNRHPKPGDRVTLVEFDRAGKPSGFLVAVDRETFAACDSADLWTFFDHWENGEAWYIDGPVRAVLVELPPREAARDGDERDPDASPGRP